MEQQVLASVGPWLILYYHKLVDWDELQPLLFALRVRVLEVHLVVSLTRPWQPELNGDWPSTAYLAGWGGVVSQAIWPRHLQMLLYGCVMLCLAA